MKLSKGLFIGLTGSIGSGKSTVTQYLVGKGFPVIDADLLARACVEPGKGAYLKIRAHFGDAYFYEDGHLNRKMLGDYVFSNPSALTFLNETIHPCVREEMEALYVHHSKAHKVVFADVPLLFESGLQSLFDAVWVVYTGYEEAKRRIVMRDGCTEQLAENKLKSQMPIEEKVDLGDEVIDNSGTMEDLYLAIEDLLGQI